MVPEKLLGSFLESINGYVEEYISSMIYLPGPDVLNVPEISPFLREELSRSNLRMIPLSRLPEDVSQC